MRSSLQDAEIGKKRKIRKNTHEKEDKLRCQTVEYESVESHDTPHSYYFIVMHNNKIHIKIKRKQTEE